MHFFPYSIYDSLGTKRFPNQRLTSQSASPAKCKRLWWGIFVNLVTDLIKTVAPDIKMSPERAQVPFFRSCLCNCEAVWTLELWCLLLVEPARGVGLSCEQTALAFRRLLQPHNCFHSKTTAAGICVKILSAPLHRGEIIMTLLHTCN